MGFYLSVELTAFNTSKTEVETHAHRVEDENIFLALRGVHVKVDVLLVDVLKASDVLAAFQQRQ